MEASFSLGRDCIGWRQSTTTAETVWENVVVRPFAQVNNQTLEGDYTELDSTETENHLDLKRKGEARKFHTLANVRKFLEMWQGSQSLHAVVKRWSYKAESSS